MNMEFARHQMVRQQLIALEVVDDNILALLRELPRDSFVASKYAGMAYADLPLSLPHNQNMMTPGLEGRLLQALDIKATDEALEVGTGSGFLTACLARLSNSVVSIDIFDHMLSRAAENLKEADIDNVTLTKMDALESLPEGPFDVIAVTGSVETIDTRFIDALKPGGRLFLPVGESPIVEAFLIVRGENSDWYGNTLFETDVKPLIRVKKGSKFSF